MLFIRFTLLCSALADYKEIHMQFDARHMHCMQQQEKYLIHFLFSHLITIAMTDLERQGKVNRI